QWQQGREFIAVNSAKHWQVKNAAVQHGSDLGLFIARCLSALLRLGLRRQKGLGKQQAANAPDCMWLITHRQLLPRLCRSLLSRHL
ncbi:MAG: hypothetical protein ACK543_13660, partial [Acidovorax sp.]